MSKQVKKEVKKSTSKNFYLNIVRHIQKTNKLPDIGLSKQNMTYYIKPLKIEGIIKKVGYATWEVNPDKLHLLEEVKEVKTSHRVLPTHLNTPQSQRIRGHGFQFKLNLPRIDHWKRRREHFKKKNIIYQPLRGGESIVFEGRKLHIYDKSIIIYPISGESYFGQSAKFTKNHAFYAMREFCNRLRAHLKADIHTRGKYQLELSKQHQSELNNEIAHQCNIEGKKLEVIDHTGCWMIADNSYNLNELETIQPTADKDMDNKVVPMLNQYRNNNPYLPSEVTQSLKVMIEKQAETSKQVFQIASGLNGITRYLESKLPTEQTPEEEDKSKKLTEYIG